jgi:flagellar assembly factor FliW
MSQEMNLSDQAVGALMMALQKSLLEQSDIVPVLKNFKVKLSEEGLIVLNPPIVKFDEDVRENLQLSLDLDERPAS